MNLRKLIFTNGDNYKSKSRITPRGIMVHSTGANNPELRRYVGPDDGLLGKNQYNNHWNMTMTRKVGMHGFIGKLADGSIATYQTLPWDHRAWHGGGKVNDTHIGFEICEDGLNNRAYFEKVYNEAVELCAVLCLKYNLDPLASGVIIGHYEGYNLGIASNHGDPRYWFSKFNKSMDTFRQDVQKLLSIAPVEVVTTGSVNLRESPGNHFDIITKLEKGTKVIKNMTIGNWSHVNTGKESGYIHVNYFGENPAPEPPAESSESAPDGKLFRVSVASYKLRNNAENLVKKLNDAGFGAFLTFVDDPKGVK